MDEVLKMENRQYVVFKLGKEEYGIDIKKVTTIEKMMQITRVPKAPEFVKGVINLRGDIIPIMDLRLKFGLEEIEETEDTRITIVKIEDVSIGTIVDAVAEVIELSEDCVESITNFSNDLSVDYILGVGKINDRIVTLLNLEKLLKVQSSDE